MDYRLRCDAKMTQITLSCALLVIAEVACFVEFYRSDERSFRRALLLLVLTEHEGKKNLVGGAVTQ